MSKPNFANDLELADTVEYGRRIVERIMAGKPRPKYDTTLRHILATQGHWQAEDIAMTLLGLDQYEAIKHVARLSITKADDIVTPYSDKFE